jgi:serine/threonine protein phosphatase PrpC
MNKISINGNTDLGKIRTNNEDAFIAEQIWDEKHILAVAIDGVGGYEGGEVAAEIAQKTIVEYLEKYPDGERLELLKQAVIEANNKIYEERKRQTQFANMSCVLTACLIEVSKKQINMVHVGDTRLYQYRNNELKKLSHDHSLVGYREEIGDLTEDEAMNHPQRNIISRDVGSEKHQVNDRDFLESGTFPLPANVTLLLCSDGLCDMLKSEEMVSVLQQDIPLEQKVQGLIELANLRGGKDNVTVVLVEYAGEEPKPDEKPVTAKQSNIRTEPVITEKTDISGKNCKKCCAVVKIALFTLLALLLGLTAGWFAHDKFAAPDDSTDIQTIEFVTGDSCFIKISGKELKTDTLYNQ